jgi:lipoprotein-releasing system permease protein
VNLVGYISKKFNRRAALPRSVRTMRAMAMIGMAVAVAALVVAVSIGRGFESQYRKSLLDFNAHVIVMGPGEIPNPKDVMRSIDEYESSGSVSSSDLSDVGFVSASASWLVGNVGDLMPQKLKSWLSEVSSSGRGHVLATTPFLYREALAIGGGQVRGVVVKGVVPDAIDGMNVESLDQTRNPLSLLKDRSRGKSVNAVVGRALMQELGKISAGDTFKIMVPSASDGKGGLGEFIDVHPVGIFETGMHDYDSQFLLMNLDDAHRVFGVIPNTLVSGIEIRLNNPYLADDVAKGLEKELGPAYRVVSWGELNKDLLGAVHLERFVFAGIMALLVVVAAMNIVAVLALITIHRMTGISILKSMGLMDGDVVRVFVKQGIFIGAWGCMVGLLLGVIISWLTGHFDLVPLEAEVYLVKALPIDISLPLCAFIALFCLGVAYAVSSFAAKRLVSMPIVRGLHKAG